MGNPENELNIPVMFRLIRELWIVTDHHKNPIQYLGRYFFELSKGGIAKEVIFAQWELLLKYHLVEPIAKDLNLYHFTPKGKGIQTEKDLQAIFDASEK